MDESQDRPISTNGGIDPYGPFNRSTSSVAPERAAVPQADPSNFNYDYIDTIACVAIYDTLTSTPQIIQIPGGPTHQFIEKIASTTYREAQQRGGMLPYTVIREVTSMLISVNRSFQFSIRATPSALLIKVQESKINTVLKNQDSLQQANR